MVAEMSLDSRSRKEESRMQEVLLWKKKKAFLLSVGLCAFIRPELIRKRVKATSKGRSSQETRDIQSYALEIRASIFLFSRQLESSCRSRVPWM